MTEPQVGINGGAVHLDVPPGGASAAAVGKANALTASRGCDASSRE